MVYLRGIAEFPYSLFRASVLHEVSLIKISAKTVDEDPAGYKRWISTKEI